jgi:hypothetical protein
VLKFVQNITKNIFIIIKKLMIYLSMTSKVDIVQLIEKNPLTHLSKDYQSNLITKIKSGFPSNSQRLFVANFYCYLNCSKTDFVIDLDDIWKWLGFSRKDPSKRLIEKFFICDVDYKIISHPTVGNSKRGRPIEQILMTVNTFKKFCLKAGTSKADEIHDYYIRLEELLQETINEETTELKNQLLLKDTELAQKDTELIEKDVQLEEKDVQHKLDTKLQKHNMLVEILKTKRCVYIGEIKENEFIKIGSSKDVDERDKQLNKEYGTMTFLEIYECDNFREIEENILKDPIIIKYLYRKPIKIDGSTSQEVVQLNNKFNYNQLLTIVKKHVRQSNFLTPVQLLEKQKLDLEKYKLDNNLLMAIINNPIYADKVTEIIQNMLPKILQNTNINSNQTNKDNENIKVIEEIKVIANDETQNPNYKMTLNTNIRGRVPKGRKVQKIDSNNLKNIIKVYDSMIYLLRDPDNKGFQKTGIDQASKKNTVYKGYRWNFVEDDEDPNISTIGETVLSRVPSIVSSILQLNDTKTKILNSFSTKDYVAQTLNIDKTRMRKIVADGIKINNCYYVEYENCPKELLDNYNKPINRIIHTHSKQIKQINPISKESIVFNTLNEISIKFGYASRTILDAIENKTIWGGFIWEFAK